MRIFELAKELKVSSAEVLRVARAHGAEITSSLASLPDFAETAVRKELGTPESHVAKARESAEKKSEKIAAARKASLAAELAALGATQSRAREIRRVAESAGKEPATDAASAQTQRSMASQAPAAPAAPIAPVAPAAPAAPIAPVAPATPVAAVPKSPSAAGAGGVASESATVAETLPKTTKSVPRTLVSLPPSASDPKVIFHRAADDEVDDFDDEDSTSRTGRPRQFDEDDDSEDDLTQTYLGRRNAQQPSKHTVARPRDDSREEGSSFRERGRNSRTRAVETSPADISPRGYGQAVRPAPPRRGMPQQQDYAPQARPQSQPFPTRPQSQPFPTRPQSQPFPTRPQSQQFAARSHAQSTQFRAQPNTQQNSQQNRPTHFGGIPRGIPRGQDVRINPQHGGKGRQFRPSPAGVSMKQKPQGLPVAPPVESLNSATIAGNKTLTLRGPVLIRELAEMMEIRPNKLIADLMQHKVLVSINQRIEFEMAGKIAEQYGFKVELERARRSSERRPAIRRLDEEDDIPEDRPEDMKPRPPVVTFLGHVDHGKTSLLDYLRKSKVVADEAGGITQHIGAYSVDVNDRKITFLDTPGHAAFSAMRARGAKLTDIAVVVIAADDGIMPQTREVIKDCRQANVQILVAINKCDLPTAKPDNVRRQLQSEGLTPEEWGGDIVCCEVSAHTGAGMDNLLEMILLQADVLELQANPNRRADGYVIEAQMELGRGPTATLLVASGTLKMGDIVLIDENYGRLRGLMDDHGRKVKSVGPAQAVKVMGLSGVPEAGAEFRVMTNEKRAKDLAEKFAIERKESELERVQKSVNLDNLLDKLNSMEVKQLSIIVKADTQGTVEAICDTLRDFKSSKINLDIIGSSIGNVNANDVQRAAAGGAIIVGFQVSSESGVLPLATHDGVRINTFRIIYELFDFVKQSMLDLLDPEYREVVRGHAQIRQIFDIGKKGRIAGCQLLDGVVRKDARVRIKRARDILFDGKIASLKHYKDEVAEVKDMQEFGVSFAGYEDFAEGDIIECYALEEIERTL